MLTNANVLDHSTTVLHVPLYEDDDGGLQLGKATLLFTHDEARRGLTHLRYFNDFMLGGTLTTSEDSLVQGFSDPMYNGDALSPEARFARAGTSITADLQLQLPTPVDQLLRAGVRPIHKRGGKLLHTFSSLPPIHIIGPFGHSSHHLDKPPGILDRDLLGSSIDGTLYAFSILSNDAWRLLRFVQNLCIRSPLICPLESKQRRARTPAEPSSELSTDFSVNGDTLVKLCERSDAADVLRQMLEVEPERTFSYGRQVDFRSPEKRQRRFVELVASVTGVDTERRLFEGSITAALRYLERVLEVPF